MSTIKKDLTFLQIININLGMLGVLFAWQLTIANMSGIYSFLGAKAGDLGYLWLIPALLGLLVPLIIGYLSDKTATSFGKRLPYIFFGSWITVFCSIILPNSFSLLGVVVIFCIFTAAINAALQPFRALVGDVAKKNIHTKAYTVQAAFIGIGSTLASVTPWLWLKFFGNAGFMHASTAIPLEIKFAFYLGAIVLAVTVTWSTIVTKKYLPTSSGSQHGSVTQSENVLELTKHMPQVVWQISIVQLFAWSGLFCFMIYLTPTIEKIIFAVAQHGSNVLPETSQETLEKSTVLTGVASGVYMFVSIVWAYGIALGAQKISRKYIHCFSLCLGCVSLIGLPFVHTIPMLFLDMIGIGATWASVNSIPFAMIANVISEKKLGIYMGLFNITVCLPQIITSLGAGYVLKVWLHGNVVLLMFLSGFLLLLGAFLTVFISEGVKT